jgi:hypothetical protein
MPSLTENFFEKDECTIADDFFDLPFIVGRDNNFIKLHHFWNNLPKLLFPSVDDITLMDLSNTGVLGLCHVLDVSSSNPLAYSFSVMGQKATLNHGRELAVVGELPFPDYRNFVVESYTGLKAARKPIFSQIVTRQSSYVRGYRRLLLPLADDYRNISHVLVASAVDQLNVGRKP